MAETPEAAEVDAVSKTLLFWLDGHYYAVPADRVVKVIASPLMTRLPFLPAAARGVVAIGGKIVPVLDLRVLLGLPEGGEADGELVLISTGGETYALCADHVSQIVAGVWTGIVSWRGAPVHRLDVDALLAQSLRDNPAARMRLASLDVMQNRHQASGEAPAGCAAALLAVETAHAYVFLSLDAVVELCDTLPVAAVPDPAPHFVGAAFHRDALLPVICLDALLGHPPSDVQDRGSFIIVEVDRRRCALAVKRVIGLSREAEQGRIVPLRSLLAKLLPEPASGDAPTLPQAVARGADETPYLLVELAGQTCGFALSSVAHIHAACRVEPAPACAQSQAVGVTAIGGRVLPILDLAARLGLCAKAATQQFIELKSQGTGTFVVAVDRVAGILAIGQEALIRPPEGTPISAVARLDANLVWIIAASLLERGGWRSDAA